MMTSACLMDADLISSLDSLTSPSTRTMLSFGIEAAHLSICLETWCGSSAVAVSERMA